MTKTKPNPRTRTIRSYFKLLVWVLLVQLVLVNISAAFYAYNLSHYRNGPPPERNTSSNIFTKTWKIFVGPKFYKDTTEIPPLFPYENVNFETGDGITVDAWYSKVDSAKACVIICPGISGNKSYLAGFAEQFRQMGYNILLIDFRGQGKTEGNTISFGVKETRELTAAYEFVRSNGNQEIILYGISMGAGICIKAVADKNFRPSAIIADMPFGSLRGHLGARATDLGFPSEPFASLVTIWIGIEQGFNGFSHDVKNYAEELEVPIMIQCGTRDIYMDEEELEKMYSGIPSKQKQLVLYPGSGHSSLLDADPLKWQNNVRKFLQAVP